jgi:hypothetical protein
MVGSLGHGPFCGSIIAARSGLPGGLKGLLNRTLRDGELAFDGVFEVGSDFGHGVAFGDAAGQPWDFGPVADCFGRMNDCVDFHADGRGVWAGIVDQNLGELDRISTKWAFNMFRSEILYFCFGVLLRMGCANPLLFGLYCC